MMLLLGGGCYSNTTTLTTGNFGEWKTEQSEVSSACNNISKSYYLNINIDGVDQTPRRRLTIFNFLRKNVDEITTGTLQSANQVIAPVVQANAQVIAPVVQANAQVIAPVVNATVVTSKNITANYFIGDGSLLTGISGGGTNETGFFGWLGSLANKVTKLFVKDIDFNGTISGSGVINISGKIQTSNGIQGNYYSNDGSQGITNTTNYWICIDDKCKKTCQLQIKNGLITGCI